MNRSFLSVIVGTILLCLFSSNAVNAQKTRNYVADGVVIAFQKNNRCPSCRGSMSIGVQIENWIVRVDKWYDERFVGHSFILVEYQIYDRSLSDVEIDSELRFALRERKEYETNRDCVGNITYKEGEKYFLRPAEFTDYVSTEPGRRESIPPDLKQLPCFIVDTLPTPVTKTTPDAKN